MTFKRNLPVILKVYSNIFSSTFSVCVCACAHIHSFVHDIGKQTAFKISTFIVLLSVRLSPQYTVFPPFFFSCSSIEFDRDSDYFAIAGVTKKIKVCLIYLMVNSI